MPFDRSRGGIDEGGCRLTFREKERENNYTYYYFLSHLYIHIYIYMVHGFSARVVERVVPLASLASLATAINK